MELVETFLLKNFSLRYSNIILLVLLICTTKQYMGTLTENNINALEADTGADLRIISS